MAVFKKQVSVVFMWYTVFIALVNWAKNTSTMSRDWFVGVFNFFLYFL